MVDNKNDDLNDMAKSSESLRARKINSLHKTIEQVSQRQNKRIINTNNQIKDAGLSSEVEQSYNGILKGLNRTIGNLATGVKNITSETSKATTDAIGQYGKAIGEDISINKTNTVAMALSKATPLFGFFAAKFMETDVFKDSANKIKHNIGAAMHAGMSKAGSTVGSIFNKGNKAATQNSADKPASVTDLSDLKNALSKDIPKLQHGGYVKEGGIAELHAAEVVTPIDKLYKQFGEILLLQKRNQEGILKSFGKEFKEGRRIEGVNQQELISSLNELKAGIIGTAERTSVAWQQTLLDHPTFRNMMLFSDIMKTAIMSPIKWLFGIRGGYAGDVTRAMSSSNMFLKQTNLLALIYTKMMPRLDHISQFTRVAAEALIGKSLTPRSAKGSYTYTMFDKIRASLTSRSLPGGTGESFLQGFAKKHSLSEESLSDAGIKDMKGFLNIRKIFGRMGLGRENLRGKFEEDASFSGARTARDKTSSFFKTVVTKLSSLVGMKKDQEKREGPHSPSMAENIASTAKASGAQTSYLKSMKNNLKKLKGRLWDIILFGAGFIRDALFKGFGMFKSILTALGLGGLGKGIGKLGTKVFGGMFGKKAGTKAAQLALPGMGGAATRSSGGIGRFVGKAAGFGGKAAGIAAGGIIGGGMGLWDMFNAIREGNATGFVGNFITRGISGFLGGTDSGLKGAKRGAMKGGALGAAIGAPFAGVGAIVGGSIGVLVGGLLGFVGGKKISKGISQSLKGLKKLLGGIWKLVKFPFQLMREGFQIASTIVKHLWNKTGAKAIESFKAWWNKNGMIQNALRWVKDKTLVMFDMIKKPFIVIGKVLKSAFDKIDFKQMGAIAKSTIYHMLFPFLAMKKAFQYISNKVSSIPFVGKALRKLGGIIGDVQSGELSNKVEAAMGLSSRSIMEGSNYSNKTSGILARESANNNIELRLEKQRNEKLRKELESIKNGNDINNKKTIAMINQTSNTSNSNSTVVNGGSGGSGNKQRFSGAHILSADVLNCNIF